MKPSSSPANSNQPAKLDPQTRLGLVHLTISDLERSVDFYQRSLGMKIHRRGDQQARLGAGAEDLLVLTADPKAVRMPRRSGLYHFALLLPSRPALARSRASTVASSVGSNANVAYWAFQQPIAYANKDVLQAKQTRAVCLWNLLRLAELADARYVQDDPIVRRVFELRGAIDGPHVKQPSFVGALP